MASLATTAAEAAKLAKDMTSVQSVLESQHGDTRLNFQHINNRSFYRLMQITSSMLLHIKKKYIVIPRLVVIITTIYNSPTNISLHRCNDIDVYLRSLLSIKEQGLHGEDIMKLSRKDRLRIEKKTKNLNTKLCRDFIKTIKFILDSKEFVSQDVSTVPGLQALRCLYQLLCPLTDTRYEAKFRQVWDKYETILHEYDERADREVTRQMLEISHGRNGFNHIKEKIILFYNAYKQPIEEMPLTLNIEIEYSVQEIERDMAKFNPLEMEDNATMNEMEQGEIDLGSIHSSFYEFQESSMLHSQPSNTAATESKTELPLTWWPESAEKIENDMVILLDSFCKIYHPTTFWPLSSIFSFVYYIYRNRPQHIHIVQDIFEYIILDIEEEHTVEAKEKQEEVIEIDEAEKNAKEEAKRIKEEKAEDEIYDKIDRNMYGRYDVLYELIEELLKRYNNREQFKDQIKMLISFQYIIRMIFVDPKCTVELEQLIHMYMKSNPIISNN
jgi:hypothetical protein